MNNTHDERVAAKAGSKVYRKVCNGLGEIQGVSVTHSNFPSRDFTEMKASLRNRLKNAELAVKLLGEQMIRQGLHPRFPR